MAFLEKRKKLSDRRSTEIDFKRRRYLRRERQFVYERNIYLSDTNAFQSVYFANYMLFIGEAREDLLEWVLGENVNGFMSSGIGLVTVDCIIKYKYPLYVFEKIKITVSVQKLTRTKLTLEFEIANYRTKKVNAYATMTIGATMGSRVIALPDAMTIPLRKYLVK